VKSCVRDVMATPVVAVKKTASFKGMIVRMQKARVSAFPVINDDGRVIGVVSQADMLNREADLATSPGPLSGVLRYRDHQKAAGATAAELMTSPPVTVGPDTPLAEAARLMRDHRVKRLPVTNATGHLIGIVSRADVLSVYSRPDEEIRREILENVILNGFFADPDRFEVTVSSGVVTLGGHPETAARGRDIVAEIWHVEGVVAVRDRLAYPSRVAGRGDDA